MTQIAELIALVRLLHRRQPSLDEIMLRIAISRATAFRHIDLLRDEFDMEISTQDGRYMIAGYGIVSAAAIDQWEKKEDEVIRAQYADTPTHQIADFLGRTTTAVHTRAYKLGATGKNENRRGWSWRRWSEAEDDMVRQHYPLKGMGLAAMLTGRTGMAIAMRARHLGVAGKKGPKSGKAR